MLRSRLFKKEELLPTLALTPEEQQALITETDVIIAETLHASEDFVTHGRQLNPHNWKFIKSREKYHLYLSRHHSKKKANKSDQRPSVGIPSFVSDIHSEWTVNSQSSPRANSVTSEGSSNGSNKRHEDFLDEYQVIHKYRPPQTPMIIAYGLIDGQLEDVAFGAMADTDERIRLRHLHIANNDFDDYKILATIQAPSQEDPFRFVVIKWGLRRMGSHIIKARDLLFVESAGIALDSNGDRVHYVLIHSIQRKEVPEFTSNFDIVRMKCTVCFIHRMYDELTVEAFCLAFFTTGGDLLDKLGTAKIGEEFFSSNLLVEGSYMKKLLWMMQERQQQRFAERENSATSVTSSSSQYESAAVIQCQSCERDLRTLSAVLQGQSVCRICLKVICRKCLVTKRLATADVDINSTQKIDFCIRCLVEAKRLSAWDVAMACHGC